uniref:TBC1 domain family member 19 n=1 Tax=Pavo cristatus TaxID=9049 RepID=A0A8C9G1V1_PAVCR
MLEQDNGLSLTIARIVQRLKGSSLHSQLERQARVSPAPRPESRKEKIMFRFPSPCHPAAPLEHMKEPLAYMRKAQGSWEKRILKSLNSMCTELSIPLAQKRPASEQKELLNKWNEMGTDEPDLSLFRPVYAPKDFLEVRIHETTQQLNCIHYSFSYVRWKKCFLSLKETRKQCMLFTSFQFLIIAKNGCNVPWPSLYFLSFSPSIILSSNFILILFFSLHPYSSLASFAKESAILCKSSNIQVLLCFSRDTSVLEHFAYSSATPPKSYIRGKLGIEEYAVFYPPNGKNDTIASSSVAPLCFLYHEPSKLYQIFREMYVVFRFDSMSGIVSLCLLFETLLQTHLPQLFYHLREIGAQPLRISFKWMVRAFSGYLATDQLLLLWDRILGYNSLEILAGKGIIFTKYAVLADLSTLKVMPLLQIFLFATIT